MQYTGKPAMQFSQPFFVAGPPNCMQFYPCFTSPPEPQNFPMYNGQSYNGPFQDVIGEGDVSSVVLPDGTVQLFFIPASSAAAQCKRCSQNTCWNNNPSNNGPWFIRSVNNPNLGRAPQHYASPNYYNPNDRVALPPCPGFQPNQGVKFHNDRCTSTEDIGYFCPRMQQKYNEQSACCAGVVCHAPCKCPPNCVGIQPPIYQGFLGRDDSEMSVDEPRRGKKRKKRNVDCACSSVCSINCKKNRKRQKRKYSDSSSSESSDESYKERKKREKACKKQCKKLEKERQKREKERQKRRKELEKEEKKLKEKEEKECRKLKKHDAKKTDSCATDSCACSDDKQKGDTPPVCDTDPQSEPCSSLLYRLGSAISNMMSTCASPSSTSSSCSIDSCESSKLELAKEELQKHENDFTEYDRETKKIREAEKKRLEKEIKKLEAEEKKSEKELIKRIAKEQKLQEKERKKREQRKRHKEEGKCLKQQSASKNEKTTCSCSASKKPCCFEDPCAVSLQNDYGKGDKDTKHKTRSDCICPLSKQNYHSSYPCSPERQYSKDTKYKTRSDCACRGASKQSSSLVNCSCTDSAMSIDRKNYSGDSETKCKRRDLKIIDITEDPCKDVGAYCKGPTMANKQLATCGDALEVSQRNCGVLCESPPTANKQSATHAVQSSCGVFANILDKLGIGVQCGYTAPPPPPPCSTASSRVSFACDRDNHNIVSCAHRNPSCNPL